MNAKPSRSRVVIISTLGAAIVLPLLLNPVASAATDGSHFFVHAQDQNNPKPHEAIAGLGGLRVGTGGSTGGDGSSSGGSSGGSGSGGSIGDGTGGTGGGGTGGTGGSTGDGSGGTGSDGSNSATDGVHGDSGPGSSSDTSAVIGVYSSGPVKLRVTQAMLDFSAANVKAQEEGRTEDIKTAPNGWQTVWFKHGSDEGDFTQDPIGLSDVGMVFLDKIVTPPGSYDATSENTNMVAYYNRYSASHSEAYDSLTAKTANATFIYEKSSGGYSGTSIKEGRYISEDGRIIAATVSTNSNGYSVKRTVSATDRNAPASDTKPYAVDNGQGMEIRLKSTTDGYDVVKVDRSQVRYGVWTGADAYGNQNYDNALRKNGPVLAYFDGDGGFSGLMYSDPANGDNPFPFLDNSEAPLTVASYNQASGQNWDGKLAKIGDFDTAKPFTPQG